MLPPLSGETLDSIKRELMKAAEARSAALQTTIDSVAADPDVQSWLQRNPEKLGTQAIFKAGEAASAFANLKELTPETNEFANLLARNGVDPALESVRGKMKDTFASATKGRTRMARLYAINGKEEAERELALEREGRLPRSSGSQIDDAAPPQELVHREMQLMVLAAKVAAATGQLELAEDLYQRMHYVSVGYDITADESASRRDELRFAELDIIVKHAETLQPGAAAKFLGQTEHVRGQERALANRWETPMYDLISKLSGISPSDRDSQSERALLDRVTDAGARWGQVVSAAEPKDSYLIKKAKTP